ncbi:MULTISPECIES: hypothetical protein [unclassified Chryseobacterium]|uniref:hypothetical protein n=1 Tax=unclassified Chryseobacterium TaxID=2593645 RepID=UPI001AEA5901|nr:MULTISPECIES: hypothetical protein [unclassified Chryseobacterium]MBP1167784.1 hypothetical protein [Chryseobacterium sp. PvR013]MDR4892911.1 hypothetical protein [Chryseobacterium sp. CFS7]
MVETRVKPFQKYTSGIHDYQVENALEIQFGEEKGFYSSFKITVQEKINEDHTKNWLIEKVEDSSFPSENKFMEILHILEQSSYPLEIKVDEKGSFLGAVDHQKNIESWKLKTAGLQEKYQNVDVFRNQYLSALEDEAGFYKNKQKEPFWNLLLFAPYYVDNGGKSEESVVWNIKGIGDIECHGIISAEQREYGFESSFISEIKVPAIIKEELEKKYLYQPGQYQVKLNIEMEYNSRKKQYSKKKADFILSDGEKTVYRETITMT